MSVLDVEQLLEPISAQSPCGDNLEYDADFGELERASQGTPEQQFGNTVIPAEEPDWKVVRGKAIDLFSRTKDLRVMVYLLRAVLRLDGLVGFRDVVALFRGLVDKYWQEVHPQLDPDDDLDPTLRVNAIAALCDQSACLKSLFETPIVTSPGLGKFSIRDYQVAIGELPPRSDETPPEKSTIDSAFRDSNGDMVLATSEAVASALTDAQGLESALAEHVGSQSSMNFEPLTDMLSKMSRVLSEQVTRLGLGKNQSKAADEILDEAWEKELDLAVAAGTPIDAIVAPPPVPRDEVHSREDVVRLIDKICEYYQEYEPSSPVPLLLKRAKRLVNLDFLELLRELVPSGLSEAEMLSGSSNS